LDCHHDFTWLQSHSGVSTSEIHGSDGYYRYQSDTDDTLRTTFDSVHSVQRIDGSGDTRYQGNRGLAGDGWNSNWYEESPSGGGIEVSQGSYHLALTHDDDRPNAYDVTVASGSTASVELPGPYRLPTNPQANTPPSGALGPGGFSPPEDPSEVAGLRDQVAVAGSSAAAANAAQGANFLVLVQSPGNPETPGTPASENSLQGAATMAGYVQSQIGTPDSANPAAIAAGAATGLSTNVSGMIGGRADLCERFPDTCLANELVVQGYAPEDIAADQAGFGFWNVVSIGFGSAPIAGSIQSVVELITGYDHIAGEPTSRLLAAGGIFAGILPGGKGLLKGGSKAVTMAFRHVDDVPARQVARAVGSNRAGWIDGMADTSKLAKGRKGGAILNAEWREQLVAQLKTFDPNLKLRVDDELLELKGLLGGFQPQSGTVILRSDATLFEAVHELGHAKYFTDIGSDAAKYLDDVGSASRELEAWRYVLNYAERFPGRFTADELANARSMFNEEFYKIFGVLPK
jgi:hypothetical protein